jgi:hypothetical protein
VSPEPGADVGTDDTQLADLFHTDDDLPRARRQRSHLGTIDAPPFLERLLAPVTAVVVVIVVILLLIWINGGSAGTRQSNAAVGAGSRTAAAKPAPGHHRRKPPAPAASATPSIPPAAVGPTRHHHAAAGTRGSHHRPARLTATAPLIVLNNSTRSGLASAVASQATHKGWPVSQVGNLQRIVAKTTVYYAPGRHAAAVHLAHQFASVQRIAPNRAGHMHGHGLTLVVTRSWRL